MKEANNLFIKIKMEVIPNMRNQRIYKNIGDFSDENARLRDSVVLKDSVLLIGKCCTLLIKLRGCLYGGELPG